MYSEDRQIPAVRDHKMNDVEIEIFKEKAGYFEHDEKHARSIAERLAVDVVLDRRKRNES